MDILKLATEQEPYLIQTRRYLHENPELSGVEFETIKFVLSELDRMGIRSHEVENGGVLGYIDGEKPGKTVLLRADVDALPIQESTETAAGPRQVISKVDGASHMCGHDANTAMLLAAGKILNDHKAELDGNVILMFERGEEGTGNLRYILDYLYQNNTKIDGCWAVHTMLDQNAGEIAIMTGGVLSGVVSFDVTIKGLGGHGSRPDASNNPLDCFVAIYNGMHTIRMKNIEPYETLTWSVGMVEVGTKANIVPETLRFAGTARLYDEVSGQNFRDQLVSLIENTCKAYHCEVMPQTKIVGPSLPVINNADICAIASEALDEYLPGTRVGGRGYMNSDSQSMTQKYYPGCYAFLGTNNPQKNITEVHHTPRFDIDEDVMKLGTAATVAFAVKFLQSDRPVHFEAPTIPPSEMYKKVQG